MFWNSADTKRLVSWKVLEHFVIWPVVSFTMVVWSMALNFGGVVSFGIYLKQNIVPLLEAFALQEVSQLWFEMGDYSKVIIISLVNLRHQFCWFHKPNQTCYALAATEYEWQWELAGQEHAHLQPRGHLVIVSSSSFWLFYHQYHCKYVFLIV